MFDPRTRARLAALPADALEILHGTLEDLARDISEAIHIAENRQTEVDKIRRRRADIGAATPMLATYLQSGMTEPAALRACAQQTGIELEDLAEVCLMLARQMCRRFDDRRLRRAIMKRVALGWTDAEIAAKTINPRTGKPYHPKSINRIQRQERQKARKLREVGGEIVAVDAALDATGAAGGQ